MFSCSTCNKVYKYKSEFLRHELSHSQPFMCKVCQKTFSFISALLRHENQHKRGGKVQCPQCERAYRDEKLLRRHINYSHSGTFTCSKCKSVFHSELALKSHLKIHRPESEREYRCDFTDCGKTFNFAHILQNHKLTHTNTKKYFCNFCGKGFVQAYSLKTHLITHSESSKWLYCGVDGCHKKFSTARRRKKHLSSHQINSPSLESAQPPDQLNEKSKLSIEERYISLTEANYNNSPILEASEANYNNSPTPEASTTEAPQINVCRSMKEYDNEPIDFSLSSNEVEPIIRSCKAVLGCCLVNGDGEIRDNCLCSQMISYKNGSIDHIEMKFNTIIKIDVADDENVSEIKLRETFEKPGTCKDVFSKNSLKCKECAFNDICDGSKKQEDMERNNNDADKDCSTVAEMPTIQYKSDGTVKVEVKADIASMSVEEDVPSNSCEAVLGSCMVSGAAEGGCLCRQMTPQPPHGHDHILEPNIDIALPLR